MARANNLIWIATLWVLASAEPGASGPFEDGVAAFHQQHYVTAMNLWRPLAEAGNPEAQANIGVLYRDAQGVPPGRAVEAYMWFSLAAASGNNKAAGERDALARSMSPAQIAEGKWRVGEWKRTR
jgi:TPR repeat protein